MSGGAASVSMAAVGRLGRRCLAAGANLGSSVTVPPELLGHPRVRDDVRSWAERDSPIEAPFERC